MRPMALKCFSRQKYMLKLRKWTTFAMLRRCYKYYKYILPVYFVFVSRYSSRIPSLKKSLDILGCVVPPIFLRPMSNFLPIFINNDINVLPRWFSWFGNFCYDGFPVSGIKAIKLLTVTENQFENFPHGRVLWHILMVLSYTNTQAEI